MKATCGGCDTVWFGQGICHCATCHETFSTIQHFDAHRSQRGERGECLDPGALKVSKGKYEGQPLLKRNKTGVWVGYQSRPEELNAA